MSRETAAIWATLLPKFSRHHVGAAGLGVHLHHLQVGEGDEGEHHDHGDAHRHEEREGGDTDHLDQRDQGLLGGVGRRRDDVGGQHGQRRLLVEALRAQLLGDERGAQEPVLEAVAQRLGELRAAIHSGGKWAQRRRRRPRLGVGRRPLAGRHRRQVGTDLGSRLGPVHRPSVGRPRRGPTNAGDRRDDSASLQRSSARVVLSPCT